MNTSQPPSDDLMADWPADPDNEALAQFAAQLQKMLPEMAPGSLEQVQRRMWGPVSNRSALSIKITPGRLAMAAGILLAVGIGGYFTFRSSGLIAPLPPLAHNAPSPDEAPVEDVFEVEIAGPGAPTVPEKALLRIDDYQTLFMD